MSSIGECWGNDIDEPKTPQEFAYNKALKRCRCTVERSFGCLKCRFRCLHAKGSGAIKYSPAVAATIITACCVLHNYCRVRNIKFRIDPLIFAEVAKEIRDKARCHRQQRVAAGINQDESSDSLAEGLIARQRVVATF